MRKDRSLWFGACAILGAIWLAFCVAVQAADSPAAAQNPARVNVLAVHGVISPATSDFVTRGLRDAAQQGAALVILQLDTPGGLDVSMRSIIQQIIASPIPVVGFVGPGGARAASAGVFILYASHVAAMTPASNLGAATPVSIGFGSPEPEQPAAAPRKSEGKSGENPGSAADTRQDKRGAAPQADDKQSGSGDTMTRKVTNDAAAYLRSLAQLRGRSVEFAQDAVLHASSLSSAEARKAGVVDIIAKDIPDLLAQLNGREVTLDDGRLATLHTDNAIVERIEPDWRTRLLAIIANPQVALVLMMVGVYGLFFEMVSPGAALPGVAGLICLLLGLYAFQLLPVNWAGVGLVLVGVAMMVGEAFLPSFGALGVGGIIAFVVGGMMLSDTGIPAYDLSLPFLIGLAVAGAALIVLSGTLAARAHRHRVVSGREAMQGRQGIVTSVSGDVVYAEVNGENWRVHAARPLARGDHVRVTGMDGLTLLVEPANARSSDYEPDGGNHHVL